MSNSTSDLDIALAAARWIRAAAPPAPAVPRTDLYGGAPGVVLFFIELFFATGDPSWLTEARRGADELAAGLDALAAAGDCSLYGGVAGVAFALEETFRAGGDPRHREAARRALAIVRGGAPWERPGAAHDLLSGTAGIGLLLSWAGARMEDPASLTAAAAAGRRLLALGLPAHGGLKWVSAPEHPYLYPNLAHGTSGVCHFLCRLFQATGDRAFLDASLAGARYLEAVAERTDGGFRLFHHEPGGESLFYLGWCHGPAGTARLFLALAEATGDGRFLDLARQGARSILGSGIPERRVPGLWNNVGQCCGTAGIGDFLLTMDSVAPDPAHGALARRIARDLVARATPVPTPDGEGLKWIHAEHRDRPELLAAQTGLMQGAAGVGTFLLHLDAAGRVPPPPRVAWQALAR